MSATIRDNAKSDNARTEADSKSVVPMRRQYLEIKRRFPDVILLFRLGDFYETFDEDAHIAADVLDALNVEIPDIDPDELDDVEPWEEGDLAILADMGLPEPVLAVILSETDLYPDEQIDEIAQRLGFDDVLSATLDKMN